MRSPHYLYDMFNDLMRYTIVGICPFIQYVVIKLLTTIKILDISAV